MQLDNLTPYKQDQIDGLTVFFFTASQHSRGKFVRRGHYAQENRFWQLRIAKEKELQICVERFTLVNMQWIMTTRKRTQVQFSGDKLNSGFHLSRVGKMRNSKYVMGDHYWRLWSWSAFGREMAKCDLHSYRRKLPRWASWRLTCVMFEASITKPQLKGISWMLSILNFNFTFRRDLRWLSKCDYKETNDKQRCILS